ncbi:EAL and GGDEF domain-containing protein [Spirulina sp. 06S082]|uniref:sensor domain-containing protein n=1 Tax=Spirulina sp. 06S082 TaxID=3110248 RepID=UPI002B21ACB0|nr:EAL domain-containing protein [Spirulina sp. 06S082]MEA5471677.1 EAL domain-containing protein [Spirulina sp. 06S082]
MNRDRSKTPKTKIWLVENTPESFPDLENQLEEQGYTVQRVSTETYFHLEECRDRPDYILCGQPVGGNLACQKCQYWQYSDLTNTIPLLCLRSAVQNIPCDWEEISAPHKTPSVLEMILDWLEREKQIILSSPPCRDPVTRLEAENQQLRRELQRSRASEEQLLRERTRLLEAQNVTPSGSWEFDAIAKTIIWSPETFQICGLDPQQPPPTYAQFLALLDPEDRKRFHRLRDRTIALGQSGEIELKIRRPSGETRHIFLKIQPILNSRGQLLRLIGTIFDISESKEVERERELFFTFSPDLLCLTDFSGNFKRLSPSWEKVLGYSLSELMAQPFQAFIHPEDREITQNVYEKVVAGESLRDFKNRYRGKNGQYHWLEWTAVPLPQGQSIYAIARDISDRIAAEQALKLSEAKYKRLVENSPDLIYGFSENQGRIYYSPSIESMLGYSLYHLDTNPHLWQDSIHPKDRAKVDRAMANCLQGQDFEIEYRIRDIRGNWHWLYDRSLGRRKQKGETIIEGLAIDITDRKQAEKALRQGEARLHTIIRNTSYGILLVDRQGIVRFANPAALTLFNRKAENLIDCEFGIPMAVDERIAELDLLQANGQTSTVEMRLSSLEWEGEQVYMVSLQDITDRKQVEKQLRHRAFYDALTDLPNRVLFGERLESALKFARQNPNYQFAVLFLDLDRSKIVNDSLGHLLGDKLLIAIANLLKTLISPTDIVARFGGDEFTILLDDIRSWRQATSLAEEIGTALQSPFQLDGHEVFTTASIGIAFSSPQYAHPEELLRNADLAMYQAKAKGRARYEIFNQTLHDIALQRLQVEQDLRRALLEEEFRVFYQPIVNLRSGQLQGFEDLIRWLHPQNGWISPDEFIPIAEETGLIVAIGEWVLREACRQKVEWQTQFPIGNKLIMSVNLSGQQLKDPEFLAKIDRILAETGLKGNCLKLELTESMLMEDVDAIVIRLSQVRMRAIQLSIDDFGTGYSSLSYLQRFPVNTLKIDRSFVQRMCERSDNLKIVETIITLAHQLGMNAIAEGIETPEQLEQLHRLGCEEGQGYLFAMPLIPEEAEIAIASPSLFIASGYGSFNAQLAI